MYLLEKDLEGLTPAQKRKARKIFKEQEAVLLPSRSARMKRYEEVRKETYQSLGIKEKREEVYAKYRPQIVELEQKIKEMYEQITELREKQEEEDNQVCSVWYRAQNDDAIYQALVEIERGVREKCEATLKAYLDECHEQSEKVSA